VAPLTDIGMLTIPPLVSLFFLIVVLAMAAELTRDVARTAKLSAEVRASEHRWRTLAENVHLVVIGLDRDQRINYLNPHAAELTGFAPDELLGRKIDEVSPPDLRASHAQALESHLAGERSPFAEALVRTRGGTSAPFSSPVWP